MWSPVTASRNPRGLFLSGCCGPGSPPRTPPAQCCVSMLLPWQGERCSHALANTAGRNHAAWLALLREGGMQLSIAMFSQERGCQALNIPCGSCKFVSFKCLLSTGGFTCLLVCGLVTGVTPWGRRFGPILGITEQYCKLKGLSWITQWMMPVGAWYFFLIFLISFSFFFSFPSLIFVLCVSLLSH